MEKLVLSDEERRIIESYRKGHGIILNANFGFGVKATETPDGRIDISVNEQPIGPMYDGPALRRAMSAIVRSWQRQLGFGKDVMH